MKRTLHVAAAVAESSQGKKAEEKDPKKARLEDALARIRQFRAQYGNEQNPVKKRELGVTIAMEQIDVAKVELELAEKEGNPTRIIDKRVDLEKAVLELQEAKLELQEAKLELDKVEWQEKTATNHANLEKAKTHDDQSFWNTRWLESLKNEDVTQVQLADCRSALATFSAQIPLKVEAKRIARCC
jgi:succinate dehydrogenase/fumarate reductase flavoprotein subunit